MEHTEILAELNAALNECRLTQRLHSTVAAAVQIIIAQAERLNVIDGVDIVARQDAEIESLKARVAELERQLAERASAAQGEPTEWLYRVPGTNGTWHHTTLKEFADEFPRYNYEGRAIYSAPPPPDADNVRNQALDEAIACVPGGSICDPQQIADAIRALKSAAPAAEPKPRFQNTSCSQCGQDFGPGDSGYSSCGEHQEQQQGGALG